MDTHFSVEINTKQKINDLRKEAGQYRLLNRKTAARQERSSFLSRFLSWISRTPGRQQDKREMGYSGQR